ncbi:hypothetical protein FA95DRAFT_1098987 [Auriscalpium vulgare]|uniref:Uncharacterized protein n=1 Tax=Auriscalpium vulgare TaxID=40419 RepID=A0ACB8RVU7_9AGAM|nr:hypothetical protein FA95DRAFT_1098987 [Auriscalpium vulgare]
MLRRAPTADRSWVVLSDAQESEGSLIPFTSDDEVDELISTPPMKRKAASPPTTTRPGKARKLNRPPASQRDRSPSASSASSEPEIIWRSDAKPWLGTDGSAKGKFTKPTRQTRPINLKPAVKVTVKLVEKGRARRSNSKPGQSSDRSKPRTSIPEANEVIEISDDEPPLVQAAKRKMKTPVQATAGIADDPIVIDSSSDGEGPVPASITAPKRALVRQARRGGRVSSPTFTPVTSHSTSTGPPASRVDVSTTHDVQPSIVQTPHRSPPHVRPPDTSGDDSGYAEEPECREDNPPQDMVISPSKPPASLPASPLTSPRTLSVPAPSDSATPAFSALALPPLGVSAQRDGEQSLSLKSSSVIKAPTSAQTHETRTLPDTASPAPGHNDIRITAANNIPINTSIIPSSPVSKHVPSDLKPPSSASVNIIASSSKTSSRQISMHLPSTSKPPSAVSVNPSDSIPKPRLPDATSAATSLSANLHSSKTNETTKKKRLFGGLYDGPSGFWKGVLPQRVATNPSTPQAQASSPRVLQAQASRKTAAMEVGQEASSSTTVLMDFQQSPPPELPVLLTLPAKRVQEDSPFGESIPSLEIPMPVNPHKQDTVSTSGVEKPLREGQRAAGSEPRLSLPATQTSAATAVVDESTAVTHSCPPASKVGPFVLEAQRTEEDLYAETNTATQEATPGPSMSRSQASTRQILTLSRSRNHLISTPASSQATPGAASSGSKVIDIRQSLARNPQSSSSAKKLKIRDRQRVYSRPSVPNSESAAIIDLTLSDDEMPASPTVIRASQIPVSMIRDGGASQVTDSPERAVSAARSVSASEPERLSALELVRGIKRGLIGQEPPQLSMAALSQKSTPPLLDDLTGHASSKNAPVASLAAAPSPPIATSAASGASSQGAAITAISAREPVFGMSSGPLATSSRQHDGLVRPSRDEQPASSSSQVLSLLRFVRTSSLQNIAPASATSGDRDVFTSTPSAEDPEPAAVSATSPQDTASPNLSAQAEPETIIVDDESSPGSLAYPDDASVAVDDDNHSSSEVEVEVNLIKHHLVAIMR